MSLNMKIVISLVYLISYSYGVRGDLESNGYLHTVLYSSLLQCTHSDNENLDVSGVRIDFHDYANNFETSFPIYAAGNGILNIPGLNKTNKFVVFVPGYMSVITLKSRRLIRDSFKNLPDTYVIFLNDLLYTNPLPTTLNSYIRSVRYAYYIGKALGEVLVTLANNGVSQKKLHLIGHSLGAQIAGYAGRIFSNITGTKISRLSGLDPAGPCYDNIQNQLRSGQADFVDIYHCNANEYGTAYNLGDTNFIINNGVTQPKCKIPLVPDFLLSEPAAQCSHMACQNFYFATVGHPDLFPAFKCDSYNQFRNGKCWNNDYTFSGYWTPGNTTGAYYLSTGDYNIAQF